MPFSQSSQLSSIVGFMEDLQPASILDVGAGMGQYGFLARTNLENLNLFRIAGDKGSQKPKSEWNIVIDGIEGFPVYKTPVHDYAYNHIYWGDALAILPTLNKAYDLVLAIDILEHFDKAEGFRFIEMLKKISANTVLVSTPKNFVDQEVDANPYENHRSVWSAEDLKRCDFNQFLENQFSWIACHQLTTKRQ